MGVVEGEESHRGVAGQLRLALAQAIIEHKAASLVQSVRKTNGADDLVEGVLSAAIQEEVITPKLRERLLTEQSAA